ncbi:MFS transporter [Streptomyces sp. SPB162]|uniref:MFS transporter n=1 Tax=Streptomyces sp. SPB162 TaxID=2940560 RepID=UPI00240592E2|nr:MFS transporter [Streptomyces sp. SPB162]MDF9814266.1 EmrB/QacA subfamily drug resistance transporter [Streptomyces sp. SPB162]
MATTTPTGVREAEAHGGHAAPMSHRQIMEALSGLLLGLFVAILSSTIVSNALPTILADIGGGQSAYTWVVTAALLAVTATTPLWGKMSDLVNKKLLIQIALVIYVLGSIIAGFSTNPGMLIACRVLQGVGAGGLSALTQVIMAAMISPRERGRYSGYLGAVFAVATVGGPLVGGVIVDTDWLGWRWCFYVGVPFAIIALIVLQKTLHLPVVKRKVKIDWSGAFFISAAVSLLMIWVSLGGTNYPWMSWQTYVMVPGAVLLGLIFLFVESKASEPIIPLRLFRNKTITLTSIASLFVGVAMFAGTVFLSQYFQLARGKTPTMSGVMTIPLIAGLFISSTVSGQVITRTGRWKGFLVGGGVFLTAGSATLGLLRYDTPYWQVAVYMALLGLGVGMMMQNLVLAVQNQVTPADLGAASSLVTFFRSLGGAVGVSALGAVLGSRVTNLVSDGLAALGIKGGDGGGIPDVATLPAPVKGVVESAYGRGIGDAFLYAAPFALVALLLVIFVKEVALKTNSGLQQVAGAEAASAGGTESTGGAETATLPATSFAKEVAAMTPVAVLDDRPGDGGTAVFGTVKITDGTAIHHAKVTLISLQGQQLGKSVTGTDGRYLLQAPGAGSYVLIAAADGHQPQASTVLVGDTALAFDVVLSGAGGLAGTVLGAIDGLPVVEAMVVVTDVRGEVLGTGKTGDSGSFAFGELPAGDFTVAVNAPGFRPAALPVEVAGAGATRVEVVLQPGAQVRGVVRAGADRRPLPDAKVVLVDAAGNVAGTTTTGADGAYAFTDLDSGEYSLVASGYPPLATALSLQGRGAEEFDVELNHPEG